MRCLKSQAKKKTLKSWCGGSLTGKCCLWTGGAGGEHQEAGWTGSCGLSSLAARAPLGGGGLTGEKAFTPGSVISQVKTVHGGPGVRAALPPEGGAGRPQDTGRSRAENTEGLCYYRCQGVQGLLWAGAQSVDVRFGLLTSGVQPAFSTGRVAHADARPEGALSRGSGGAGAWAGGQSSWVLTQVGGEYGGS